MDQCAWCVKPAHGGTR